MHCIVRLWDNRVFHWVGSVFVGVVDLFYSLYWYLSGGPQSIPYWKDWQSRGLPHFPLPPLPHDIPVQPSRSDNCGEYLATMIVTYVDVNLIQSLLPKRLRIDTEQIVNGKHPIIYMFGYTQHLHCVWFPIPGFGYLEFAAAIPNLRLDKSKKGCDGPFVYVPVLYLQQLYPTLLGWIVGYNKKLRHMDTGLSRYSIRMERDGPEIVHAEFAPCAQQEAPHLGNNFEHWKMLCEQPQVNRFFGHTLLFLHYHLAWPNGIVQPVNASVDVLQDDGIPGLPPGHYSWPGIHIGESVGNRPSEGAFRLSAPFELLAPFARLALDGWHPDKDD